MVGHAYLGLHVISKTRILALILNSALTTVFVFLFQQAVKQDWEQEECWGQVMKALLSQWGTF